MLLQINKCMNIKFNGLNFQKNYLNKMAILKFYINNKIKLFLFLFLTRTCMFDCKIKYCSL